MRDPDPQPGYTADDLKDLLATREFVFADLFTLTTKYGDVLRFATALRDVGIYPPDDLSSPIKRWWSTTGLKIEGLQLKNSVGVEVDEQETVWSWTSKLKYIGLKMQDALAQGRFDGTTIRRDRVYAAEWKPDGTDMQWVASVHLFSGRMSAIDSIARASATIKVKSDLLLLNIQMPHNTFQPSCVHTLFDPGCGLDRIDFEVLCTAKAGSTSGMIKSDQATPDMVLGRVDCEDGSGVLEIRTIRKIDGDKIYLAYPLNFTPNVGLLFKAYPGCSRTYARCGEFANQVNFKGFPFVPVSEAAI